MSIKLFVAEGNLLQIIYEIRENEECTIDDENFIHPIVEAIGELKEKLEQQTLALKDIAGLIKSGKFNAADALEKISGVCNYEGLQERIH